MTSSEERARRKRRRERQVLCQKVAIVLLAIIVVVLTVDLIIGGQKDSKTDAEKTNDKKTENLVEDISENSEMEEETETETTIQVGDTVFLSGYTAVETEDTAAITLDTVASANAILINLSDNTIVAHKGGFEQISPASMTKVLTLLVAAEQIEDLDATFVITQEITDYVYINDCSNVGFEVGEEVTVEDLFYGTILPSGADAAIGLAICASGSHEAFVDKMNEKLEELGLSETTHFTNCVGLYDEDHYSTVYDIAIIMKAALENDFCRQIITTKSYTTSATEQHPDGISIYNAFMYRIEDFDTCGEVLAAKTGYVDESGNCAVSYMLSDDGVPYICTTAGSTSSVQGTVDHVEIYNTYASNSAGTASEENSEEAPEENQTTE